MDADRVRVRFAPSPTGHLHIGSARTALYNWAFARRHGGDFILRIDDTDPERSTPENTERIIASLRWLGLDWDEGPEVGGDHGPYFQTQRSMIYAEALSQLKNGGKVYPCFCTINELQTKRDTYRGSGGFAGYDRTCRSIPSDEAASRVDAGEPHVWRLAVPEERGDIVFRDAVRGDLSFSAASMDDMIIVRSDGSPTYNLATVVDDAHMGITHVIRGDDHLSNTPRQILVFEALGYSVPVFAHTSLTLGPDGKRLSKRHGATSVEAFHEMGFLAEALVNYIVLLGWSLDDKTTVMSRETIVEHFSLERISSNPGIFDMEKLDWMNGVYIREMSVEDFAVHVVEVLVSTGLADPDDAAARLGWYRELAGLLQERIKRLEEVAPLAGFLFLDEVTVDEKAAKVLGKEGAVRSLSAAHDRLGTLDSFSAESIEAALREIPAALDLKPHIVFQAVRVAVSGSTVSPPLFESIALLGRERTLSRIAATHPLATG